MSTIGWSYGTPPIDLTAAIEAAGPESDMAKSAVLAAAPLIEAAVRAQIAAEIAAVAAQYRATLDEWDRVLEARQSHDFDSYDITRYGAYASSWESAARHIARGATS